MKKIMLIGAMLSALIACGDETTETYARLAAHSNKWESSNFKEDYDRMVVYDLVRLKETDAVRRGVERWMLDVLNYPEGDPLRSQQERICEKNSLLWMVNYRGLCDITNIGGMIVDYAGHLHNVEESAAALVAAANAAERARVASTGKIRQGLRSITDEEALLTAAKTVREDMLPHIGRYWRSLPDERKAACRSNIVERARLTEAEAHTVFGD
jgi:hypothetical protein